jgi:phosphoribosyl-AMP cyclohydrolase / phosphoribosyl-ATP pyrophosphohydrolase
MIIQSIDLMGGKAVQLKQGKALVLTSAENPVDLAQSFDLCSPVAVIDLDAALGQGSNLALIREICKTGAEIRVGGGIRDVSLGQELLRAGAQKIIVGTAATPEFLAHFPAHRVMVALDHRQGTVVDQGWTNSTGENVLQRAERLGPYCDGFLCTFVEDEGGMGGMPLDEVRTLVKQFPKPVTVAGGVAHTEEAVQLSQMGLDVQVGMALYTGKLNAIEVLVQTLDWGKCPLIPTVVQDLNGQILMLAYSSPESLRAALTQKKGIYFSRSRQTLWEKGQTSAQSQTLVRCRMDCDRDSLIFTVEQKGVACHTEAYSCFGSFASAPDFHLETLYDTLKQRKLDLPEGSFSAKMFQNREKLLRKINEEAFEVTMAAVKQDRRELVWEIADTLYFMSLLAVDEGLHWREIVAELGGRHS